MTENKYDIKKLDWQPHSAGLGGERAVVKFDNGFAASCLRGGPFYTSRGTYEIAVMDENDLRYDTPITDDVLGYLSEKKANKALLDISNLPKEL